MIIMKKRVLLMLACLLVVIALCLLLIWFKNLLPVTVDSDQYPADFSIRFESWTDITHKNILDTKEHILHRESSANGTANKEYYPDERVLRQLWASAVNNSFMSLEQENIPISSVHPDGKTQITIMDGSPCFYKITVEMNGEKHTLEGSTFTFDYQSYSKDAKRFCKFLKYMQDFFAAAKEYPKPE